MRRLAQHILTCSLLFMLAGTLVACESTHAVPQARSSPALPTQTPLPMAFGQVVQADYDCSREEYQKAIDEYSDAIGIDPNYEKAFLDQGVCYGNWGDLDSAIGDLTQAIALDPNDDKAYYFRALVFEDSVDPRNSTAYSIPDFTQAILLNPDDPDYYDERGKAYTSEWEYKLAIADFDKAVELQPDFVQGFRDRAMTYGFLYDFDNALKDYTQVIALEPDKASNYYDRALSYEGAKDYSSERKDLEQALTLSDDPDTTKNANDHLASIQGR